MQNDVEAIVRGLSDRQKAALLAFRPDIPVKMADARIHYSRQWAKASELGVSGNTLASMTVLGGVDPKTLEGGPCLVTDDWCREGHFWSISDLGLSVQSALRTAKGV